MVLLVLDKRPEPFFGDLVELDFLGDHAFGFDFAYQVEPTSKICQQSALRMTNCALLGRG